MKGHPVTHPILVIDGHEDGREAILMLLSANEYRAIAARNGETALMMLRGGLRPCVILLDLVVPGDGWSFRTEQMADPELAQIPVIGGATIQVTQKHVDPALRVRDILMKPFDLAKLFALLDQHLRESSRGMKFPRPRGHVPTSP